MARVGNLFVDLRLDTAKFSSGVSAAQRELGKFGAAATQAGKLLTSTITLPIVAIGAAALKAGADMQKATSIIRTGTGATGDALKLLQRDFKEVAKGVPQGFEEVGMAITGVSSRLKLTGEPLQTMTRRMLDLSRVAGQDVKTTIEGSTRVLGDWSIATDRQSDALDFMFRTTQQTGIGLDRLMGLVVQFGAPLRNLGFSFEQSAALMGKFEREGVNIETVMSGLRQAVGKFARGGVDAAAGLQQTIEAIRTAGSEAAGNTIALEIFGARAGADMAAAVREGRFEIDDFVKSIGEGTDTIAAAAAESLTLGDRFSALGNRISIALEPLGTRLVDIIEKSVVPALEKAIKVVEIVGAAFGALPAPVQLSTIAFFGVLAAIGPLLLAVGKLAFAFKALMPTLVAAKAKILLFAASTATAGTATSAASAQMSLFGASAAATTAKVGLLATAGAKLGIAFKAVSAVLIGPWGIALAAAVAGIILYKDEIADAIVATTDWIGLTESSNKILRDTGFATAEASAGFKNVAHSIGIGVAGLKELTAENSLAIEALSLNRAAVDKLKQAMLDGKITVADYQNELRRLIGLETGKKIADIKREFAEARQEFAAGRITLEELGDIVGRNNDLYAKWVDRIQDVKKANSEAVEQARKDLSFYQKFLLQIANLPEVSGIRRGILGKIDPSGLAGATEEQVAANFHKISEAAREAAASGRVVGAVFAEVATATHNVGAANNVVIPTVDEMTKKMGGAKNEAQQAAESAKRLAESVTATLNPVATLSSELSTLAKSFTPAQLAAAGYAEKAAVAVAEQKRINEAIGITDQALPPLIAKLLELAQASKAAADWTALASKGIESLGIEAAKVPATLQNIIGPMTTLGTLTVKNADQFQTFSKGALAGRQALREMEAQLRATEQKVRDFTDAKLTDVQILHRMGSEISSAAELAKVLGVELDETTAALFRQIKGAEQSAKFAKQWQDAWSTAVGNIVSRFTKGVTDMIFEGKRMSFDLKDIFRDLAKSLLEILIGQLFSPLFKFVNQLGAQIGDWVGGLLGIPTSGATAGAGGGGGGGLGGFAGGKPTGFLAGLGATGLGIGGSFGGGKLGGKLGGSVGAQVGSIGGGLAGMFLASKLGLFGAGAAATGGAVAGGAAAGGAGAAAGAGAGTAGGGLGIGSMGAGMAGAVKSAAVFLATNPIGWAILGGLGVFAGYKLLSKSPEQKISSELGRDFAGISAGKGDVKQIIASLNISKKASEGIRKEISTLIALQQGFGAGATAQTQQAVLAALSSFQVSAAVGSKALSAGVPGQQIGKDVIFDLSAAVKQAFAGVTGPLIEQLTMILGGSQRFAQALPNFAEVISGLIGPGSQAEAAAEQFGEAGQSAATASTQTVGAMDAIAARLDTVTSTLAAGLSDITSRMEGVIEAMGGSIEGLTSKLADLQAQADAFDASEAIAGAMDAGVGAGEDLASGLAAGAVDQLALASDGARKLSADMLQGLKAVGAIAETFPGFAEKIKSRVQEALQPRQGSGGSPIDPDSLIVTGAPAGILPQSMIDSLREQVAGALNGFSGVGTDAAAAAASFTEAATAAAGAGSQSQMFLEQIGSGLDGVRDRFATGIESVLANLGNLLDGLSDKLAALQDRLDIEPPASGSGAGAGSQYTIQIYGGDPKVVRDTVIAAARGNTDGFTEDLIYWQDKKKGAF